MRFAMWSMSLVAVLGVLFMFSGGYNQAVDYKDSRVVLRVDPDKQLQNAVEQLTDEDYRQIDCLARNMYFEARDQGREGMKLVTDVVFNRMESGLFPDKACEVITQSRQFSWVEDGRRHVITDHQSWTDAMDIALNEWLYHEKMPDQTGGALRYHADYVSPKWFGWVPTLKVGRHIFYRGS